MTTQRRLPIRGTNAETGAPLLYTPGDVQAFAEHFAANGTLTSDLTEIEVLQAIASRVRNSHDPFTESLQRLLLAVRQGQAKPNDPLRDVEDAIARLAAAWRYAEKQLHGVQMAQLGACIRTELNAQCPKAAESLGLQNPKRSTRMTIAELRELRELREAAPQ
jgi:hypothetical protein